MPPVQNKSTASDRSQSAVQTARDMLHNASIDTNKELGADYSWLFENQNAVPAHNNKTIPSTPKLYKCEKCEDQKGWIVTQNGQEVWHQCEECVSNTYGAI